MTHKQFLQVVVDLARLNKWMMYFTWNSRHSPAGFPDLILLRGVRQVVIELKIPPDKIKPEQQEWLDGYSQVSAEVYVWMPGDWEADIIEEVLR